MNKRLIIVRHAERPDIPIGEVGNNILLNDQGVQDSFAFGQSLNQKIISIKTSPISRCVQTATEIAKAIDYDPSSIKTCTDLGSPGYFISDGNLAWQHWQEKGHLAVNQFLLDGNENWDGFYNLKESAKEFKSKIKKELLSYPSGTHVWITHDTILAAFATRVLKSTLAIKQWPGYLSYLEIEINENEELNFRYHQKF